MLHAVKIFYAFQLVGTGKSGKDGSGKRKRQKKHVWNDNDSSDLSSTP